MKKIVLYYFYTFLFIDLLNGFVIRYLGLSPALSPGQLVRGMLTLLLLIDLLNSRRITKDNKYIYMFLAFIPAALCIFVLRDGVISKIPNEIIALLRPLFFLLVLHFVNQHRIYYRQNIESILLVNLVIYSGAIILSASTGIGNTNYEGFYVATKSFFYGNNVTSITGFTLTIYYAFKFRIGKIYYFYYFLAFLALYLSGGKIILAVPFLTLLIYLYSGNSSGLKKISISVGLVIISVIFVIGVFDPKVFINNPMTQKYYSRAFREAFTDYDMRQNIGILPLRLYSYVSFSRAYRANELINLILDEPENIFFGRGVYRDTPNSANHYTSEMDLIDMFYYYGIIGLLIIFIPVFKIMFPLIKRMEIGRNSMIMYMLFIYSFFAGHVIPAPMAGSLFALFLGIASTSNERNSSGNKIAFQPRISHTYEQ